MKPNHQFIYPMRRMNLWCTIMIKKRLLCDSAFDQIDWQTLILKNGGKKSFSNETKASMSFVQIRGMSLWCPIMKRTKIVMWIRVCPNWQININSKKWWKYNLFLWNQSINFSYPNEEKDFTLPNMKRKEIAMWICVYPNWERNFNSKQWWKEKFFLWNQSISVIYPNK